jgi:hypothetical protein
MTMRLFTIALLLMPTVASAGTLPSGLADPLASASACTELAESVAEGYNPILAAIAISEAVVLHKAYGNPNYESALAALDQHPDRGPINYVFVSAMCRSQF